jgi:hypothetical protein
MRHSRRAALGLLSSVPPRPLPAGYRDLAERTSDGRHFARRDSRPKMGYTYLPLQYHEENPMQDLIHNYVSDLNKTPRGVPQRVGGHLGRAVKSNGSLRKTQ